LLYGIHAPKGVKERVKLPNSMYNILKTIISAVTTDLVREEQFVYDMCLLGAVTVEITQILTRAGIWHKYIWNPLKIETGLVLDEVKIY